MNVDYFCFFVGMGRSGSSVIAAIMDAHPMIVFGNDFTYIPQIINKKITKERVIKDIFERTQEQNKKGRLSGKTDGGAYSQKLDGQIKNWDQNINGIKIIGSKSMSFTTKVIAVNPKNRLDKIRKMMGPIKVIN